MSKLSFRARALDAAKPMPIYMTEELPDLPDYSAINRAVPQMPSGMEKEEECEHHLQRAICTGLIIPTPEVSNIEDTEAYDRLYTTMYKMPRQLIHMQPFAMEQDIPDYDMDSEDERFVNAQSKKMDLTPLKFEEMMDRLEKGSGQTVVTLQEAKGLLKEDDDLIIAVYDYWLNKRLKTVVPLIPVVKTEHRIGSAANNPYLAFRRRTEKMQTRKNRKNDETSYEKMLKLRRDLSRTVTLLELVKRREKTKRELLHLTIEVFEKRYQAQDFSGQLLAEISAIKSRPAFAPIFSNQFGLNQQHWLSKVPLKEDILVPRKEKRQYKRRKHKENMGSVINRGNYLMSSLQGSQDAIVSSEEELETTRAEFSELSQCDSDGMFSFRRKLGCSYLPPTSSLGEWRWWGGIETEGEKKFRFYPTNIATPRNRHIGLARKRIGRGGRVILDRSSGLTDEFWSSVDFTVYDNKSDLPLYQPKTPPEGENQSSASDGETPVESLPNTLIIDVETLEGCESVDLFHGSEDEHNGDKVADKGSTGGKRGSAEDAMILSNNCEVESSSETETDSVNAHWRSEREMVVRRTRTGDPGDSLSDDKGCVSDRFRVCQGKEIGIRLERFERCIGHQNRVRERKEHENFSFKSLSDLHRPGKNVFRRNYRIGGFRNIRNWRKTKGNVCEKREGDRVVFTTTEISLSDLFADSSINLMPETELETNDDSLAILDKLGLDDDFIKKEPEISLEVDSAVDKAGGLLKSETGQTYSDGQCNSFQKQRLKLDKNIFEFSETDFLKYETDCDVDDLLPDLVQNDVVGCCGLFGLTPNSRFNLVSPTYLPLDSDRLEGGDQEEVADDLEEKLDSGRQEKKPDSPAASNYGQIADITSHIESHEVTLQLKMNGSLENNSSENLFTSRLNVKNDFPDGYQLGTPEHAKMRMPQDQSINYIFALNHHNYTISGPPGHNTKHPSVENARGGDSHAETEPQSQGTAPVASPTGNSCKQTAAFSKSGPGILRTYKGNNARTQFASEGTVSMQETGKKAVSNGPASIGVSQRRMVRGGSSGAAQAGQVSSAVGLSLESTGANEGFAAAAVAAGQGPHFGGNQNKASGLPQRKVSLLVKPSQGGPETVEVDLGNDSMETVDIETSEGDPIEGKTSGQDIAVDGTNQINVRKNNSLPMEVT